jgi:hypothetical protein
MDTHLPRGSKRSWRGALVGLIVLVAGGCGGSGNATTTSSENSVPGTAESTATTFAPVTTTTTPESDLGKYGSSRGLSPIPACRLVDPADFAERHYNCDLWIE